MNMLHMITLEDVEEQQNKWKYPEKSIGAMTPGDVFTSGTTPFMKIDSVNEDATAHVSLITGVVNCLCDLEPGHKFKWYGRCSTLLKLEDVED